MKIYLAGPMSGIAFFNHPAFNSAAAKLREMGHEVCNPAEFDAATYKHIPPESGSVEEASKDYGFDYKACLKMDLDWIFEHAEAIALLPGWEKSKGANAELALARALGLKLMLLSGDGPHPVSQYDLIAEQLEIRTSTARSVIITHMFEGMSTII